MLFSSCSKEENVVFNPIDEEIEYRQLPGVKFSDEFIKSVDMFHVGYTMFDYSSYLNKYKKDTLVCVSGLKDKKLWLTLYKPNFVDKTSQKVFEWNTPDTLSLYRRVSKYDTIKYVSISPYQMIVNEEGIALLCYVNGDPYDSDITFNNRLYQIGLISKADEMKDMGVLGCISPYGSDLTINIYPMYGSRFILSKKKSSTTTSVLYSMDGEEKQLQIKQLQYGDYVPISEGDVISKKGVTKVNILKGELNKNKYISNDDIINKLGISFGVNDKISYSLKSINDNGTCTYKVYVKYASWDVPDAVYEVNVNILDWTLL